SRCLTNFFLVLCLLGGPDVRFSVTFWGGALMWPRGIYVSLEFPLQVVFHDVYGTRIWREGRIYHVCVGEQKFD
ncbi:hypothetical protein AVEN_119248-1, partial [Araneus ventricosus]